jgi:hypothetical protein
MREPLFFTVPAGTKAAPCRGCSRFVYWIITEKNKKPMPVDVDVDGGLPPSATESGRGLSHYATCPAAARFRKRRPSGAR